MDLTTDEHAEPVEHPPAFLLCCATCRAELDTIRPDQLVTAPWEESAGWLAALMAEHRETCEPPRVGAGPTPVPRAPARGPTEEETP